MSASVEAKEVIQEGHSTVWVTWACPACGHENHDSSFPGVNFETECGSCGQEFFVKV